MVLPKPGSYIVAVSGGVDSVSLLHALRDYAVSASKPLKLTVAHYDHGIRADSAADRKFVASLAKSYGLPFVYQEGRLGATASEATARRARYQFLREVQQAVNARAIITAHHQDDAVETAIINILRGSGRKGLTALRSTSGLQRPLLHLTKQEIADYASANQLNWREDATNKEEKYLRNYVRLRILPRFDHQARESLWAAIKTMQHTNHQIDTLLVNSLHMQPVSGKINRLWFNQLPHNVARELMAAWLRAHGVRDFDKATLERLVVAAKVARPGSVFDILHSVSLVTGKEDLALASPER